MGKPDMTSAEFRNSGLARQMRGQPTDYKNVLLDQIRQADLPEPESEFKFNDKKNWRFDYFFPAQKVAVEYEGGIFDKGVSGHTSVSGIMRDIEKYNEAALAGVTVIRVTAQTVVSGAALRYIKRGIENAKYVRIAGEGRKIQEVTRTLKGLLNTLE